MRSAVVFPQPDGPSSTMNSPSAIDRVSRDTAVTSPKRLVTSSKTTSLTVGSLVVRPFPGSSLVPCDP